MAMHIHELHAALVHAPLVFLPAAAAVDLSAVLTKDPARDALGRKLWWLTVGGAVLAGVSGLAASQEIKAEDPDTNDMLWLHGVANFGIVLGGTAIALWRSFHRPSATQTALALAASGLAVYTASLGAEMVYGRGVGVQVMPKLALNGVRRSPRVLSRSAPVTFVRDALAGVDWLVRGIAWRIDERRRKPGRRASRAARLVSRPPSLDPVG
jgi:uncharacterized membrane protein